MAMKAGTVADFSNSMAEAIENALEAEYLAVKGEPLPAMAREDRRMMLAAIAQGVLRYLKDNVGAFELSAEVAAVPSPPGTSRGTATLEDIDTTGVLYG